MRALPLIASAILFAPAALAQEHQHPPGHQPAAPQQHDAHAGHETHAGNDVIRLRHYAPGALGSVSSREASGTSWQPEIAGHAMAHHGDGDWSFMAHGNADLVFSSQEGPRGDDKAFVAGMLMGVAQNRMANGDVIQFRGMISPDPLMGKRGYPLLLAAGETADGVETLVDRQHPHDLFMELSASYAKRLTDKDAIFVYGGLPGEPAFGPPAFMHRPAAQMSPEAPITHHWFDSTHITFGVATAGWVHDRFKVEASGFRGREPDQDRYDIETGDLDSTAVRLSWNPTANLALQASWADVTSPEQLHPDVDEEKYSISALYSAEVGRSGMVSLTGAFARKDRSDGVELDAWLGEAAYKPTEWWTFFSRAEAIETDELGGHHGPVEEVAKIGLGLVRDWNVGLGTGVKLGVGALVSRNWTSDALDPLYGGDPWSGMAFVRLSFGH